jgi:aconitate hydratase
LNAQSDSFGARSTLELDGHAYTYFSLPKFAQASGVDVDRLPVSLRILLENLLRYEDGRTVTREHILALGNWNPTAEPNEEIAFYPARVVLQD